MIRKGEDGRTWVVIPHEPTKCVDCPARGPNDSFLSCLVGGGGPSTDGNHPLLCNVGSNAYGRVLADSPEARAELFAARVLRS